MSREFRKTERTPEQLAEIKAVRERFQRERPSPKKLVESGEYYPPIPTRAYFEIKQLLHVLRQARESANLSLADVADTHRNGQGGLEPARNRPGQPDD